MSKKRLRTTNRKIKLRFPDGVYSFWEASQEKNHMRVVFRVKETGPDGRSKPKDGSNSPEDRMANLVGEIASFDPETAARIPNWHRFRPADMSMVVKWCAGHSTDLYDLLDSIALKEK